MPLNILFAAPERSWREYRDTLPRACAEAGLDVTFHLQTDTPEQVDYIIYAPNGPVTDFSPFTQAKAVLSLWAGVERMVGNPTLTLPLARMVDNSLTEAMVEWVTGHVLRHHLGMDAHILGQDGVWRADLPPLARDRSVTVLGLGALGSACANALTALNFNVSGWSRKPKSLPGITCHHGDAGLRDALGAAEILVLLLPDTPHTTNLLNKERLGWLPEGAVIINPGRGPLIDDDALLAALDAGQLGHATLDVFRQEPLPADHPYWAHPKVTVTPHIAAATQPLGASRAIAENLRRCEAGEPLLNLVDRDAGY